MKKLSFLLVLVLILSITGMAFAGNNGKMDQTVADEITYKPHVRVIVRLVDSARMNPHALNGTVKNEFKIFNGFAGTFPSAAIEGLSHNPNVAFISADNQKEATLIYAAPTVFAPNAWSAGYTGQDVKVAVLDTGIDGSHPALAGRVVAWYDTINGQTTPYDDNGHGTHCAGIVGSHDTTNRGIAPDCNLIGVKVLNDKGIGYDSDIIAGIEWAIQQGADVISMSLGGRATSAPEDDPLCVALKNAWINDGVVSCIAAGNSGPRPRSIDSPGIEPTIITVGAADDKNTITWTDDEIARFSSRGPTKYGDLKPDFCAPGVGILSCEANTTGWVAYSGTSMATPNVAGAVALILQANPSWTPDQVKTALMNTAHDLGLEWGLQGAGEIDVWEAINY
ncbi:MAG: S8 family serine peptidase [Halanaerobiales bacterium]|nr:S8 family serine peptidase [Halanaerobiales bacterium]